jgi:hypothetical protein
VKKFADKKLVYGAKLLAKGKMNGLRYGDGELIDGKAAQVLLLL